MTVCTPGHRNQKMGIIISRFRKKKTTEEVLDDIGKRVSELQKFRWRNQQLKKQYIGSLLLYSIIMYIVAALVFFLYYLPETWKDRALYSAPLLIFPVIVWLLKKFLHWYFVKRIAKNDIELEQIRSKKKQILEEVMEKETYKKAKEILEKYDPDRFKKVEKPVVVTPKPVISPASTGLRQRSVGLRAPTPQSGRGRGLSPRGTPHLPQGRGTPMQPRQIMTVGRNGTPMMSPYNQPPGPPLPRPIIPRERGKMDKLVEYFVGDGPQNRYALICRYCYSHNGMALKEEFEFLTFRCCYCYQLNPARKQKPFAPKIDFTAPSAGTPLQKIPSRPSQPATPNTGVKTDADRGAGPNPVVDGVDGKACADPGQKGDGDGEDKGDSEEETSDEENTDEEENGEEEDMEVEEENRGKNPVIESPESEKEQLPPRRARGDLGGAASEQINGNTAPASGLYPNTLRLDGIHELGQRAEVTVSTTDETNGQSNSTQ